MKKEDYKKTKHNEIDELKASLLRAQADYANFRRRNDEERSGFIKSAHADIVMEILPVLDNFSRAAQHVPKEIEEDGWVLGVKSIEKQLEQILENNGLEKIVTCGQKFDHNVHEAIGKISDKKKKNNEIISEELAGYFLNGKLLRPAKVIVNQIGKE